MWWGRNLKKLCSIGDGSTLKLTCTHQQLLEAIKVARFGVWDWNIITGTLEWIGAGVAEASRFDEST